MIMKQLKIISINSLVFFLISFVAISQTSIGTKTVQNSNVLLEFNEDENRGIILPWVINQNDVVTPVGGTLIFDSTDKKVKFYRSGLNPSWQDISINSGDVDTSIQTGFTETSNKTIIGAKTSMANGVLVLEATDKAMVLPNVTSPHLNIIKPVAGTMVYDKVSKMMCLFNGLEWSFWKIDESL